MILLECSRQILGKNGPLVIADKAILKDAQRIIEAIAVLTGFLRKRALFTAEVLKFAILELPAKLARLEGGVEVSCYDNSSSFIHCLACDIDRGAYDPLTLDGVQQVILCCLFKALVEHRNCRGRHVDMEFLE